MPAQKAKEINLHFRFRLPQIKLTECRKRFLKYLFFALLMLGLIGVGYCLGNKGRLSIPVQVQKEFDLGSAFAEQDEKTSFFLHFYTEAGGLGKEKSAKLREAFNEAKAVIESQLAQLEKTQVDKEKEYRHYLLLLTSLWQRIDPYLSFMEVVGPMHQEIMLLGEPIDINSASEMPGVKDLIDKTRGEMPGWSDQLVYYQADGNLAEARDAYKLAIAQASSWLTCMSNAVDNNDFSDYRRCASRLGEVYPETAESMIFYLKLENDPEIKKLLEEKEEQKKTIEARVKDQALAPEESPAPSDDIYQNWQTYRDEEGGFEIKCPPGWFCANLSDEKETGVHISPKPIEGQIAEWFLVSVEVDQRLSLESFQTMKNESGTSSAKVGSYEAERVDYTHADGRNAAYYFRADGHDYFITVCWPRYHDQSSYTPYLEPILASFKLL